jgi:hypothetical protein
MTIKIRTLLTAIDPGKFDWLKPGGPRRQMVAILAPRVAPERACNPFKWVQAPFAA